ncbi:MAG TPA: dehydratase [Planctomycetes bacterium]|nr:dehydratase [Planctomycetota bacterium]
MISRKDGPRRGLWYEEFEPGAMILSPARTITEADIVLFAGLSGDQMPLHTDETAATRTAFRGRVAHGMLVQSVATGLAFRTGYFEGTLQALAGMTIRWPAPVRPGDTIRLALRVERLEEPSRRSGIVVFRAEVKNQEDRVVSEGDWSFSMLRDMPANHKLLAGDAR